MHLGRFELNVVSGGRFWIDGGTMFGVVPRVLWNRVFPADEDNLIEQETNCVLLRSDTRTILIDTGFGAKLPEKQRRQLKIKGNDHLVSGLAELGVTVDDIDTVILSHLHFDHAGGATQTSTDGTLQPTFPNAEYVVQRQEWMNATAGYPVLRGAYPQDNLLPLHDAKCLRFIDGNTEIVPGIRSWVTGGHTQAHQALLIESEGQTAIYLGDSCPTTRHFPMAWGMGYDLDVLQTRRIKAEILGRVADESWLALFDHDPDLAAAYLQRDDRRDFNIKTAVDTV